MKYALSVNQNTGTVHYSLYNKPLCGTKASIEALYPMRTRERWFVLRDELCKTCFYHPVASKLEDKIGMVRVIDLAEDVFIVSSDYRR